MNQFNQQFITAILDRYGLEPDDYHLDTVVATWLQKYDRAWIVKAIIESLHRGRYKVKSVDSILIGWQRMGQPCYKFTPEFEREILHNLPTITDLPEQAIVLAPPTIAINTEINDELSVFQPLTLSCDQLNPEESAPFFHHARAVPTVQSYHQPSSIVRPKPQSNVLPVQSASVVAVLPQNRELSQTKENTNTGHIVAAGSNFQLFRTLRAIVEPNKAPSADFSNLDCDSFKVETNLPMIANLRFSLGSTSVE
jgi:hypothetical protein